MATEKKLPMPERPKYNAPKRVWVNYLAAHGVSVEVARSMTLAQLQSWEPSTPTSADVKAAAPQPDPTADEAQQDEVQVEAGGPPNAPEPDWAELMGRPQLLLQETQPPTVHESWCRVMESVRSVAKGDYNKDQRFHFRGIDAVLDAVGPALREHRVHVRPRRIINTSVTEYLSKANSRMVNRLVHMEWEVTGPQGDSFVGESMGEAADSSDKSMSKAQSVAYRVFLLQALSIPTGDDPDFETHERATPSERQQAVQQAGSGQSYRSREEYEAAQRQAKAGEENQDSFPASSNVDPWTGTPDPQQDKPQAAQQDARAAEARKEMWRVAKDLGWEWGKLSSRFKSDYGIETAAATVQQLEEFKTTIIMESDDEQRAKSLVQNELGGKEVNPDGGTHF